MEVNIMKKTDKSLYVTIGLWLLIVFYLEIRDRKLKSDGILLTAKTTSWKSGAIMNLTLEYEFYYKGKKCSGDNSFSKFRGNIDFENRYFPVMYYPKMGGHS